MRFTDGLTWIIVGYLVHFTDIHHDGCRYEHHRKFARTNVLSEKAPTGCRFEIRSSSKLLDFAPIIFSMSFLGFFRALKLRLSLVSILNNYLHPVAGDARSMWR